MTHCEHNAQAVVDDAAVEKSVAPELQGANGVLSSHPESELDSTESPWEILLGAATPPGPLRHGGLRLEWVPFAKYPNHLAAQIVAGLLEGEGVPAIIEAIGASPSFGDAAVVWVPRQLLHRARWVFAWPPPTEAELAFLATGVLSAENGAT